MVASLTDDELLSRVQGQAVRDREENAAIVASLAEVEARRLYRRLGFSSLYTYCTLHLGFSEHAAFTRMRAAYAALRFTIVLDLLMSGELSMTTVSLLWPCLTDANHLTVLEAARHKTKREVEAQVAALQPRADLESEVIPLADGCCRLEVTLSADAYRDLRRLQELMRHAVPNGDASEFVCRGLSLLREQVERRKLADVRRPRGTLQSSHTRYVPAAVRRAVWKRDGAQCAFVGATGRCVERSFLELHHVVPFAKGGETTIENLQVRCRAHNQFEAEEAGLSRTPPGSPPRARARTRAAPGQP